MFLHPDHDHHRCVGLTLDRARAAFSDHGLRLTDLRLRVFTEIAQSHEAIGAYDVIERLSRVGSRVAPISVYRAIDALMEAGVVHRLESKNAFFACHGQHATRQPHIVMSCSTCSRVGEAADAAVFASIDRAASVLGFMRHAAIVEITGHCAHCRGIP